MKTYISVITLDKKSIPPRTSEIEHERRTAMADLIDFNHFAPREAGEGPYHLLLSVAENRLTFHITQEGKKKAHKILLSLTPFRGIIRDYFMLCESYLDAVKNAHPSYIETLDMARRGVHNEGSDLVKSLLAAKVEMDSETARRFFTLICALHIK